MTGKRILPTWLLIVALMAGMALAVCDNCRNGRPWRIEQKLIKQEELKRS